MDKSVFFQVSSKRTHFHALYLDGFVHLTLSEEVCDKLVSVLRSSLSLDDSSRDLVNVYNVLNRCLNSSKS